MYGMLYTVRVSTTMTSMLLTRAGVSEGKARRMKGNFGGSTRTGNLRAEGREGSCRRDSVMGGPACPGHLLARSEAPRGSAFGSTEPRLERLPVRELGVAAGLGQGPLRISFPVVHDGRVRAQDSRQRHPGRHPQSVNLYDGGPNTHRRSPQIGLLTREGDVRCGVGPTPDVRHKGDGGPITTRLETEGKGPPGIRSLSSEGDVQGDVAHSNFSQMRSPNTPADRGWSPGGTSS